MGYTTTFTGKFDLNRPLDDETYELLYGLGTTRRMKRVGLDPKYGTDGEFYYDSRSPDYGQEKQQNIVDYNQPPSTQPGLWLQWIPTEDRLSIEWDEGEKFYNYVEWLHYIVDRILKPRGYSISGKVKWFGEDHEDSGVITAVDNEITALSQEQRISDLESAFEELFQITLASGAAPSLLTAKSATLRQRAKAQLSK